MKEWVDKLSRLLFHFWTLEEYKEWLLSGFLIYFYTQLDSTPCYGFIYHNSSFIRFCFLVWKDNFPKIGQIICV